MIFALVPGIASATTMSATIDFEGLSEGAIVTILSSGSGISGDPIGGSVGVSAVGGSNKAMIFDSNCSSAGCSGQDPDLAGSTGKVLIVSEDGDTTDPDDNHDGGTLSFALPGTFTVVSLQVTDYGDRSVATGSVSVGGSLIALPTGGANGLQQTVIVGLTGNSIIITTNDSFSVDNIELEWETPDSPGTGTVGYWKNHPDAWPVDEITIGGVLYTKAEAIAAMQTPGRGDKTYNMFAQLVAAKLNVAIGNDDSCISSDITAANAWMTANPLDSNVRARSDEWRDPGSGLHGNLDDYNNGRLCAPHRD
jgi:hypothetical protein